MLYDFQIQTRFTGVLWTKELQNKYCNYINIISEKKKYITTLKTLSHYSKTIHKYFSSFVGINDRYILKIYWEEFKIIRGSFFEAYDKSILQYDLMPFEMKIKKIFENKEDFNNQLDFDLAIHDYVNNSMTNNLCKICYDKSCNMGIVHKNHICSICDCCFSKLKDKKTCPFCTLFFEKVLKII
jgi:hypothetical protein